MRRAPARSRAWRRHVAVPAYFPDTPEVRSDLLDYYLEVQRFDRGCRLIEALEKAGELDDTIVVVTSDNGMPFPREGEPVRLGHPHAPGDPLAAEDQGRTTDRPVRQPRRLAPTFLEAAGLARPPG